MKIAVYSRKSRLTQRGESIENQIEMCREYIRAHYGEGAEILIYEDEGYSGGSCERPRFKALLRDARAKRFDTLLCYRLDRVSRNIADFTSLISELSGLGIGFVSIRELFDTQTPMGRAMMYIASVFAQLERETIAERICDNMLELAKTGRWLGGRAPTGYRSDGGAQILVGGRAKKVCRLVGVSGEQAVVRLLFEKYGELQSLAALEAYLLKNNIQTKNGKSFSRLTIKGILQNPVYAAADSEALGYFKENGAEIFGGESEFDGRFGIMAYNKTGQSGRAAVKREISEWIVAIGRHEGIISGGEWARIQKILKAGEDKRYRRPAANRALLSGLLRCGVCGAHMRPKMHRKDGEAFSYICENKERSRGALCGAGNIGGRALDLAVVNEIMALVLKKGVGAGALAAAGAGILDGGGEPAAEEGIRLAICKNERELKALIDRMKYVHENLITDISREMLRLKSATAALKAELKKAAPAEGGAPNAAAPKDYAEVFEGLDLMEKRELLRFLIDCIKADREGGEVFLRPAGG